MKTINRDDFTKSLIILLTETFEGMPEPEGNIFLDRNVGVFTTLSQIDAEQASTEIQRTTIAAHCEHARFYLELLNNYLNKNFRVVDFNQSWRVKTVSENDWDALREGLAKSYRQISETFEKNEDWSLDTITVAMGIVAHSAYHLGAIRQMAKGI